MTEKSSWDQANIRQKLGLVWKNRKKISPHIIKDYFYLPFFLLIIFWFNFKSFPLSSRLHSLFAYSKAKCQMMRWEFPIVFRSSDNYRTLTIGLRLHRTSDNPIAIGIEIYLIKLKKGVFLLLFIFFHEFFAVMTSFGIVFIMIQVGKFIIVPVTFGSASSGSIICTDPNPSIYS
jgi:hypothetical protein